MDFEAAFRGQLYVIKRGKGWRAGIVASLCLGRRSSLPASLTGLMASCGLRPVASWQVWLSLVSPAEPPHCSCLQPRDGGAVKRLPGWGRLGRRSHPPGRLCGAGQHPFAAAGVSEQATASARHSGFQWNETAQWQGRTPRSKGWGGTRLRGGARIALLKRRRRQEQPDAKSRSPTGRHAPFWSRHDGLRLYPSTPRRERASMCDVLASFSDTGAHNSTRTEGITELKGPSRIG